MNWLDYYKLQSTEDLCHPETGGLERFRVARFHRGDMDPWEQVLFAQDAYDALLLNRFENLPAVFVTYMNAGLVHTRGRKLQ